MGQSEIESILLDLIVSIYKGSLTNRNAINVMNFVEQDKELQAKVNNSNWVAVRKHRFKIDS